MPKCVREYGPNGATQDYTGPISFEDLQKKVGGYVEVVHVYDMDVVCNEEGKLRGLEFCMKTMGHVFVGNVLVGRFTEQGLEPVDALIQDAFATRCTRTP